MARTITIVLDVAVITPVITSAQVATIARRVQQEVNHLSNLPQSDAQPEKFEITTATAA